MKEFYTSWMVIIIALRLITIFISARNEKRLKKVGAREYGKRHSVLLILAHFAYYFMSVLEGYLHDFPIDRITIIGLTIFTASIAVLYYVIYELRHIWTVKIFIADINLHTINKGFLFRVFKHPNYYLNIIPELIALGLIFHAWYTLAIGFPAYLVLLIIRIRQEVMRTSFKNY